MTERFAQALARRVVVFDGSMGATIQSMDLDVARDYLGRENCVDVLVRSRPDIVQRLHEGFLEVGSDAVETNTFGANKLVFGEFDGELVSWTYDINREAAEIARAACAKFATRERPRYVIGSIGPGTKLLTLGQTTWDAMLDSYAEQARGLIDGGVDAFIIETCQDLLQVKCAINACLKALDEKGKTHEDVPIMISITIETMGTMLLGSETSAAMHALAPYPIISLGFNCATGPTEMADHVEYLAKNWDRAISVIPNAGLPVLIQGKTNFPLTAEPFAQSLVEYVERFGVNVVGGCCGTGPEHIRLLVEKLNQSPRRARRGLSRRDLSSAIPACATSLFSPVEYRQELSFFIIGERMNASGSRKFKRLLEEENWDEIVSMAREQKKEGASAIDINVDYAGRDNPTDMAAIVQRVVRQVDLPLMIDSTQLATIEAGLRHAPGKCIINSTNFEDGEEKFDRICGLARTYAAAVVIGSIDEDREAAMARTAARKFAIAKRAFERATKVHGIAAHDIFFDPLVLPISTGMDADRRSALELIDGARLISREFPQCQVTCGLSNVSFGLNPAARIVLNSVFLHELLEAGMTSAIVHASKILPLSKIPEEHKRAALDLIYDRRAPSAGGTGLPAGVRDALFDPLQAFIDLFKDVEAAGPAREKTSRTLEERLRDHIIDGEKQELFAHLDEALAKYSALDIINDHLLDGMKTVGELFGSGQMQLPFVLQSAEVMKMAVAYLEPHMDRVEGMSRAKIVLATVKGDVHDIGKNLVDIILSNNGYRVINLGIKQTLENILSACEEHDADAVGMSGLLVKSVGVMEENLRELNSRGVKVPVLLGGAALTRHYAESHLRSVYQGPLYYGKDAFEGLRICEHLAENRLDEIDTEVEGRLMKRAETEEKVACMRARESDRETASVVAEKAAATRERSSVALDVPIPLPPFWGERIVDEVDPDEIYPFVNKVALFRGQWGFKRGARSAEEYEREIEEIAEPIFARLRKQCQNEKILRPQVVYGYYPCNSQGNDLIIYDPDDHSREIERFTFPRQSRRDRLCISDFFRPVHSGERDVVAFHCVTMGVEASHRARMLFERNEYTEYLYLHGMGVECAEALAELWHKRIRMELGIAGEDSPKIRELFTQHYRGSRYSFGYPACPDMSDQEKLFRLLRPERIGCTLTENWQIDPEQSTSAIIVHHPQAKYFNV
jgi:5-methyltetrahydrofolate--homocysteine methyltransferase